MIAVIDCGLSALKLSLVDNRGTITESIAEGYPTRRSNDRAEQDPDDWWRALVRAAHKLEHREKIRAIVPTGHMHGLVLLDASGAPLLPCLTLHDRRGAQHMLSLEPRWFHETTGHVLDASLPVTKLLWLRNTDPALLARARTILAPKDYLGLRLTGERRTDHVDAAGTGLYDLSARSWSSELVQTAGLPVDALPPIFDSTHLAASLTAAAAEALGLPANLPVLAGVGDDVELLGATAHKERLAVEHIGTTGSILVRTPPASAAPTGRVEIYPTCVEATFAAGISTSNAGSVVDWIETALGVRLSTAIEARPSRLVALPFLFGERGTIGLPFANGAVVGLDGSTDRVEIAHAFVLGIAFGLRDLLTTVTSTVTAIDGLVASGGGAAPRDWVRLRASVYGLPIDVMEGDPTAVGCAALALAALDGGRPDEVALSLDRRLVTVEPDQTAVASMNERFNAYISARDALLPGFAAAGSRAMTRETELA